MAANARIASSCFVLDRRAGEDWYGSGDGTAKMGCLVMELEALVGSLGLVG